MPKTEDRNAVPNAASIMTNEVIAIPILVIGQSNSTLFWGFFLKVGLTLNQLNFIYTRVSFA